MSFSIFRRASVRGPGTHSAPRFVRSVQRLLGTKSFCETNPFNSRQARASYPAAIYDCDTNQTCCGSHSRRLPRRVANLAEDAVSFKRAGAG